jgi:hypothetical protein
MTWSAVKARDDPAVDWFAATFRASPTHPEAIPPTEPPLIVTPDIVPPVIATDEAACVAMLPRVPPVPTLSVEPSVPARVIVFEAVRVFPLATESPDTVAAFPVQLPDDPVVL